MSTTVWAYLVVSSEEQSDTLPHQLAWARDVVAKQGWNLARVFDGVASGKRGVRSLFEDMLATLRKVPTYARPEYVLLTRLDRIGRGDLTSSMVALQSLTELGCKVWSREENGEVRVDGAMLQLIAAVKMAVAAQENEVRKDKATAQHARTRKLHAENPAMAAGTKAPYGCKIVDGRMLPDPPRSDTVRQMFEMRLQGFGTHTIAKKVAATAPPLAQRNGVVRPICWSADIVNRLLKRRAFVDANIVSEAEYQRAQTMTSSRGGIQPKRHQFDLVGAIRCECGTPLQGLTGGHEPKMRFYYACPDRKRVHGKTLCHRREIIEEAFWNLIWIINKLPLFESQEPIDDRAALAAKKRELHTSLDKMAARRERIWSAFEDGALRKDTLQGRLDTLEAEEQGLRSALAQVESDVTAAEARALSAADRSKVVATVRSRWKASDPEGRRALAKLISTTFGGLVVRADSTVLVGGVLPICNSAAA